MARSERHVVPNGRGGWKSVDPATGAATNHRTQEAAQRGAKRDLARDGGGEAVIHRRNGRIRDSDTVGGGNDPNPSRDTRH